MTMEMVGKVGRGWQPCLPTSKRLFYKLFFGLASEEVGIANLQHIVIHDSHKINELGLAPPPAKLPL
jgi:hypothetical protein